MSGEVLTEVVNYFELPEWLGGTAVGSVLDWIINGFLFLINSVVTILDSIGKFFLTIFDVTLFGFLNDLFTYLSAYIGTAYATLLMGLFGFVFLFMLFSFVFRVIRGRVHYDATIKKYDKKHNPS